jgi:hypothetical protein
MSDNKIKTTWNKVKREAGNMHLSSSKWGASGGLRKLADAFNNF